MTRRFRSRSRFSTKTHNLDDILAKLRALDKPRPRPTSPGFEAEKILSTFKGPKGSKRKRSRNRNKLDTNAWVQDNWSAKPGTKRQR